MSRPPSSTRQRLINAALELFTSQGVTETTTRQIAELAQVNEVTLFRQFGNKQGLLLAVIEDSAVFTHLSETLRAQVQKTSRLDQALKNYASDRLQALEKIPEVLRSVVGEAGRYTLENRRALGRGVTLANLEVARYLATVIDRENLHPRIRVEKVASLLNEMLFGYLVIELTSEFHELWEDREDFLESLVELFLHGVVSHNELSEPSKPLSTPEHPRVADLPASLVHAILQQAKKQGLRDYAFAYILFSTGITLPEVVALERTSYGADTLTNQINDEHQNLLQITQGAIRQVPVNQWIMGKRYGSYARNPLTQWLKSRNDDQPALFVNDAGEPMSESEFRTAWQGFTSELLTPKSQPLFVEQARQTWCVEMLMRGIDLEDLSILSGWDSNQLQPYARRAREKAAIERALKLDSKGSSKADHKA
ncbi:TetR family transcriptional regulator [Allocoleopsis franciscana]|uniref:Transcriptional regulator n=1 Tax=Allocoleopsis franciscana PCC 7113 TaxID=1173027 RepID=K9W6G2_9CYAN|nr:TetR family transcriptional regulator [Allocoleopsis franciscana]AFZ15965.1 transcriptional regulator [Allocoleopsis franciscana PCC 7113]